MSFSTQFTESSALKALTLNNWGCFHRRENADEKALDSFKQALQHLQFSGTKEYLGLTYLNLGAVLSQRGQ